VGKSLDAGVSSRLATKSFEKYGVEHLTTSKVAWDVLMAISHLHHGERTILKRGADFLSGPVYVPTNYVKL